MKTSLKTIGKVVSKTFNINIMKRSKYLELIEFSRAKKDLDFLKFYDPKTAIKILENLAATRSQIRQDLFALAECGFKKNGFFVEFGATNGIDLSNSYLMESQFSWRGILAEPGKNWHSQLIKNRKATIDYRCVWSKSGESLPFDECINPELSTISAFSHLGTQKPSRNTANIYNVDTVSLVDLLVQHKAPKNIDYLSIDTEGSEFEILKNFDFERHSIKVITCEHNNISTNRKNIFDHLTSNGYRRKFEELSMFDDWYVKN